MPKSGDSEVSKVDEFGSHQIYIFMRKTENKQGNTFIKKYNYCDK